MLPCRTVACSAARTASRVSGLWRRPGRFTSVVSPLLVVEELEVGAGLAGDPDAAVVDAARRGRGAAEGGGVVLAQDAGGGDRHAQSARQQATLTPLPPASLRTAEARCTAPGVSCARVTVWSIAGLRVRVTTALTRATCPVGGVRSARTASASWAQARAASAFSSAISEARSTRLDAGQVAGRHRELVRRRGRRAGRAEGVARDAAADADEAPVPVPRPRRSCGSAAAPPGAGSRPRAPARCSGGRSPARIASGRWCRSRRSRRCPGQHVGLDRGGRHLDHDAEGHRRRASMSRFSR